MELEFDPEICDFDEHSKLWEQAFEAIVNKWLPVNVGCPALQKFVSRFADSPDYVWVTAAPPDPGHTLLHVAARNGSLDHVRKLLELGADRTLRNAGGMRPVDIAIAMISKRPAEESEAMCALLTTVDA